MLEISITNSFDDYIYLYKEFLRTSQVLRFLHYRNALKKTFSFTRLMVIALYCFTFATCVLTTSTNQAEKIILGLPPLVGLFIMLGYFYQKAYSQIINNAVKRFRPTCNSWHLILHDNNVAIVENDVKSEYMIEQINIVSDKAGRLIISTPDKRYLIDHGGKSLVTSKMAWDFVDKINETWTTPFTRNSI